MAQNINLRENEYRSIGSELSRMHTDQLQNVESIINEMKNLVISGDAFFANRTSEKMTGMLDMLSEDVMALLKQAFEDSEAGIARGIRLRRYLIEEQWEDALELLRTTPQKNLTIFEQVVNAYARGKCCYCLDRYEEAFYELKYAAGNGGNTKYVKLANELIEKIPEKD